jgi:hypothetical protein
VARTTVSAISAAAAANTQSSSSTPLPEFDPWTLVDAASASVFDVRPPTETVDGLEFSASARLSSRSVSPLKR